MKDHPLPEPWTLSAAGPQRAVAMPDGSSFLLTLSRRKESDDPVKDIGVSSSTRRAVHYSLQLTSLTVPGGAEAESEPLFWPVTTFSTPLGAHAAMSADIERSITKVLSGHEEGRERTPMGSYMEAQVNIHRPGLLGLMRTRDATPIHMQKAIMKRVESGDSNPAGALDDPALQGRRAFPDLLSDELGEPRTEKL